jgi:hypothetical protein
MKIASILIVFIPGVALADMPPVCLNYWINPKGVQQCLNFSSPVVRGSPKAEKTDANLPSTVGNLGALPGNSPPKQAHPRKPSSDRTPHNIKFSIQSTKAGLH